MTLFILATGQTARELNGIHVASLREPIDVRPTRVRQIEQASNLIEGFAGSIVKRATQFLNVGCNVVNQQNIRMTTGNNQTDKALRERAVSKLIDSKMADHVVHTVQGLTKGRGKRLRSTNTDRQRTNEARASSNSNRIHVIKRHASFIKRRIQGRDKRFKVSARRNFWDDTTVAGILIHRCGRAVDEQFAPAHKTNASFVAGGFDSEDEWFLHPSSLCRQRTRP